MSVLLYERKTVVKLNMQAMQTLNSILGGAGFSKLFSIEVRKFTVNTKIFWTHLLVVPVVPVYCIIIALSEFVPIET